jgi:hypothetical protein
VAGRNFKKFVSVEAANVLDSAHAAQQRVVGHEVLVVIVSFQSPNLGHIDNHNPTARVGRVKGAQHTGAVESARSILRIHDHEVCAEGARVVLQPKRDDVRVGAAEDDGQQHCSACFGESPEWGEVGVLCVD